MVVQLWGGGTGFPPGKKRPPSLGEVWGPIEHRLEFNAPVNAAIEFLPDNLSSQFGKELSDCSN